jgi:hypothetical protein
MKCSKCNAEIPDSSKFCPQCAAPTVAPPQVVDYGARKGAVRTFLIGLAVAGIAFLVWSDVPGLRYAAPHHNLSPVDVWAVPLNPRESILPCQDDLHPNANWRARPDGLCHAEDARGIPTSVPRPELSAQPPQPQLHYIPITNTITNGAVTVNATSYSWYQFIVPQGITGVSVNGHFAASGGTGNDIIVYVLDEDGFANFKNGHPANTYYNSGKITQGAIGATLPNTSGTYYLVFDNRYSLITPKAVQVNAVLTYTQPRYM